LGAHFSSDVVSSLVGFPDVVYPLLQGWIASYTLCQGACVNDT
jgi:hypothetical protein